MSNLVRVGGLLYIYIYIYIYIYKISEYISMHDDCVNTKFTENIFLYQVYHKTIDFNIIWFVLWNRNI